MQSLGHLDQCIDQYRIVRKPFVDTVKQLCLEKLSMCDIRWLLWDELKMKIDLWIEAASVCLRTVFPREKQLIEEIFGDLGSSVSEACFVATVEDAASQLFSFAKAITALDHSQSPRKLFPILDLYKALIVILSDIDVIFASESFESIRTQASLIVAQLKEVIIRILSDFETSVVYDLSPVKAGGTIKLIEEKPSTSFHDQIIPDMEFTQHNEQTPLDIHLILVVVALRFNLESKSEKNKDASLFQSLASRASGEGNASLVHLFMTNNVHYILKQIEGCPELRVMIGESYLNKLNEDLRKSMSSFRVAACSRILYCLRDERPHETRCFSYGASKSGISKKINAFNATMEGICGTQARWVVPDLKLQEKLCQSITETLVPAYKSFLHQFKNDDRKRTQNCNSRKASIYIKYSG